MLPNKRSDREVQPLAALYPTVRLSPWGQVRKNLHSGVWTPGPTWSVLHPGGPPPPPAWFPLVPSDWGKWASPPETDQDSCPGWLPPVPLDLVPPRRAFLLVSLPLDLSASLPPEFCHYFLCVICVVPGIEPFCETTANWKNLLMVYKGQSDLAECQHTLQWHFQFVTVKCIEKSPTNLTEQNKCSKAPKKTNSFVIPTSTVIITAVCSA